MKSLIETLLPKIHARYKHLEQEKDLDVFSIEMDDLEAALKDLIDRSVNVYGYHRIDDDKSWYMDSELSKGDVYSAKLIMIEPIKKKTAEDYLREIVELEEKIDKSSMISWRDSGAHALAIKEAKEFLEGK